MQALILIIGGIGVAALTIGLMSVWSGFVLTKLWAWFIVPQFAAAPLSIPIAIGIALIASMLCKSSSTQKKEQTAWQAMGLALAVPAFALVMGWCVTLFR